MSQNSSSENLHKELKHLADTLEEVLNNAGDKSKAELDTLRAKAQATLKDTRQKLSESGERIAQTSREVAEQTNVYVRENPWTSVGIGAAVGAVLGILLARR